MGDLLRVWECSAPPHHREGTDAGWTLAPGPSVGKRTPCIASRPVPERPRVGCGQPARREDGNLAGCDERQAGGGAPGRDRQAHAQRQAVGAPFCDSAIIWTKLTSCAPLIIGSTRHSSGQTLRELIRPGTVRAHFPRTGTTGPSLRHARPRAVRAGQPVGNPCLLSATRFLNPIDQLHDVDSTPHPSGFKFGWNFSPFRRPRGACGRLSLTI